MLIFASLILLGSAKIALFSDFPNLRRKKFSFLPSSSAISMSRYCNGVQRYAEDFGIRKDYGGLFSASILFVALVRSIWECKSTRENGLLVTDT